MNLQELLHRIRHKLTKLRLQPIRVFCMHHVSKAYDEKQMHECDWMQIDEFKSKVIAMQQDGVKFISLTEAHRHIITDKCRRARYAVLTFDDGWSSLKNIIPWLCKQQIPVTLFVNPAYIKGEYKREIGTCLTQEELEELLKSGMSNIQIASHGWNHTLCTDLTLQEFENSVTSSDTYLKRFDAYIPYFAYPCGRKTQQQDGYLISKNIIPVYMDGGMNYSDTRAIHRELLS